MSGKQHTLHDIVRILGEALSGDSSKREVCRRHGISEQTLYRWLRQYPHAKAAHGALPGHDKPGYLRLLQAMHPPQAGLDNSCEDSDLDPYDGVPMDVLTRESSFPEDQENSDGELLTTPTAAYDTSFRDRYVVKIHGRLPRGEFEFVQIALPNDLHRRLKKKVDGSLNQAVIGLVRYALDALDRDRQTLHLFDASLPKPHLPSKESKVKMLKDLKS